LLVSSTVYYTPFPVCISNSTVYSVAPILLITDFPALVLLTFSFSLLLLASMAGITGTLLNSRPILAVYVLLLIPSFLSFVSVGYLTYKKANFSLDAKVSEAWYRWYLPSARTVLRGSRLLWVERSTSRSCSIRHMSRPFSSSRLPRPSRAFRTGHSLLGRRHSIFSRASPFDEYFGRSPLRQPRNAPFRKGYHTRALSTHSPRHIIICGIGRSSVIFGSRQTRCYETNGHTRPSIPCAERSLHFSRRQRKRDDIQASCARV
jgi:hypothetical protein